MSVNSISSGITGVSGLAQAARLSGKKAASAVSSGVQAVAAAASTFREVVSQYKVTSMTPESLTEMLQKLRGAGAISETEYKDLSTMRSELEAAGINSDTTTNLVEFYANRLQKLQKEQASTTDTASQTAVATAQRHLNWLKKVAAVQSSVAAVGVDKTA